MSAMRPKDIVESNVREAESLKKEWETELLELERRIDNITKLGSEQYLKYRLGEINADNFKRMKEENSKKDCSISKEAD